MKFIKTAERFLKEDGTSLFAWSEKDWNKLNSSYQAGIISVLLDEYFPDKKFTISFFLNRNGKYIFPLEFLY